MINKILEYLKLAWKIFIRPWTTFDTLWIILPLVLILVLIHLYFGRHRTEELGWNSAFGNSISLLWICAILFRFLFDKFDFAAMMTQPGAMKSLIIVGALTLWVVLLLYLNFFHIMPKKLAFIISSSDSVYILAYIIISVIIGSFILNINTLIASIFLFVFLLIVLQIIKHMIPMTKSSKQTLLNKKKNKKKKKAAKKAAKSKQWKFKKGTIASIIKSLLNIGKKN